MTGATAAARRLPWGGNPYVLAGRPLRDGAARAATSRFGDDIWDLTPALLQRHKNALILGLKLQGDGPVEGGWVDRVVGLEGVRAKIVMVEPLALYGLARAHGQGYRKRDHAGQWVAPRPRLTGRRGLFSMNARPVRWR